MQDATRPYVEKMRQFGGVHAEWDRIDVLAGMGDLMQKGYHIKADTGLIGIKRAHGFNTPWIHVKQVCEKRCGIDHQIKFEKFGFIPPRCMQCWKVVAMPRTLKELFELEKLERVLDRPSKCGIEVRDYTPRHYGGYFYNNSLEEGRERYTEVREAVSDMISPDIKVILKRACTEMEMKFGNAGFWYMPPEWQDMDTIIEDRFESSATIAGKQADYVVARVKKEWMKWAFSNGDMTYKEFNGGKDMFPDYQYFHEGDIQEIKNELAAAQAMAAGLDPEKAVEFRHLSKEFTEKHGMKPSDASLMLGMPEHNFFDYGTVTGQDGVR